MQENSFEHQRETWWNAQAKVSAGYEEPTQQNAQPGREADASSVAMLRRSPSRNSQGSHDREVLASQPCCMASLDAQEVGCHQTGVGAAQWTLLLKVYCILSETNAVSTLFLSAFFWAFLYSQARVTPALPYAIGKTCCSEVG